MRVLKVRGSGYTGQFASMQITLSTRQPNYQEVNLNKDKYRPRGDNANRRWRRDNKALTGVLWRTAVGALIRSLDLRLTPVSLKTLVQLVIRLKKLYYVK